VLNAAKKQVTTASNSMIGLQTSGTPCSAAAASTNYTTWPSTPPQSYTLVVSMTGAASTPSCFCTDSGTTYACGAGWEDDTPQSQNCPTGETGTETRDQQTAETCVNGTVTTGAVTYTSWNTSGCETVVNGQCNATTVNTPSPTEPPDASLCTAGLPSGVSGPDSSAYYDWTCEGENGGADSLLCREKAIVAGECAPAQAPSYNPPVAPLCDSPAAPTTPATSGTNWAWTCPGSNTGSPANCTSPEKFDGTCGTSLDSCSPSQVTYSNYTDVAGKSSWDCDGVNGGASQTGCFVCDSGYTAQNGSCVAIVNGQCASAQYSCTYGTAVSENDNTATGTSTWVCDGSPAGIGTNSGTCTSCDSGYSLQSGSCVKIVNGQCGTTVHSCTTGTVIASSESDSNHLSTWTCGGSPTGIGTNSGTCSTCDSGYGWNGSSCVASVNGSCGSSQYSCNAGTAASGSDSGGTSTWICDGQYGGSNSGTCTSCDSGYSWNGTSCVANATPVNGSCGSSQYSCNAGTAASQSDSNSTSTWVCDGTGGGSNSGQCISCDSNYYIPFGGACVQSIVQVCKPNYFGGGSTPSTCYDASCSYYSCSSSGTCTTYKGPLPSYTPPLVFPGCDPVPSPYNQFSSFN
jgi:hypothetical protein